MKCTATIFAQIGLTGKGRSRTMVAGQAGAAMPSVRKGILGRLRPRQRPLPFHPDKENVGYRPFRSRSTYPPPLEY